MRETLRDFAPFTGALMALWGRDKMPGQSTISRWLAKAQKQVKKKTEEILQRNYGLRRAEVAECLALAARSEVDVRKLISEASAAIVERAP